MSRAASAVCTAAAAGTHTVILSAARCGRCADSLKSIHPGQDRVRVWWNLREFVGALLIGDDSAPQLHDSDRNAMQRRSFPRQSDYASQACICLAKAAEWNN